MSTSGVLSSVARNEESSDPSSLSALITLGNFINVISHQIKWFINIVKTKTTGVKFSTLLFCHIHLLGIDTSVYVGYTHCSN